MEERDRIVPGSYRSTTPRAVWITNYGNAYRPGILIAWRQQYLPSVADQRPHWFGLVVQARALHEKVETSTDWHWVAHILPCRDDEKGRHAAWQFKEEKSKWS